jgi:hypothetical protein
VRDLQTLTFHPTAEKIVDILCKKTQNTNPMFFRVLISYYLAKITAMMRVKIATQDRGEIPVNLYAINLAPSGQGKGHSTNIIEEQLIDKFRSTFFDVTEPIVPAENLAKLAVERAFVHNEDPDTVEVRVKSEFAALGALAFSFDSGTTAAIKQMRYKLLMGGIGSMNLEIDEIGSNLLGNADVLSSFLELFDVGKIKQKLTKNTKENLRAEEIDGRTPTNLLLFGTPSKLLDGGRTEAEYDSFLETGYARRCIFGYTKTTKKDKTLTPEQRYNSLTDATISDFISDTSIAFGELANIANYNKTLLVSKKVSILIIEYTMYCEDLAEKMGEHEETAKAEMAHRYFKALKLAGCYAFIGNEVEITEDNFYHAVHMIEESGKAFNRMLTRDRAYVKLAKYIASIGREVTHGDLFEDLPFYRGSNQVKQEMMQYAIDWGYRNHIVIKHVTNNGIEFITGETLKRVDLGALRIAHSADISDNYANDPAPWDKMHILTQLPHHNWINHFTMNGHRSNDTLKPGFDLIVLDIDDKGVTIEAASKLLEDYKFFLYTTKRHTPVHHRFRIILPMNYRLTLDTDDYSEFMCNIFEWLPFDVDIQAKDRCRKWLTHKHFFTYNTGIKLIDARLFIPRTSKNDERKKTIQTYQSLSNIQRWFVQNSTMGGRNNQLVRYALVLVDMGYPVDIVETQVKKLNAGLPDSLPDKEIDDTIMRTVSKAIIKREKP